MTVDAFDHDYNPLFMLLITKSWSAVLTELKSGDPSVLASGSIRQKAFYGDTKRKTSVNVLHLACKNNAPLEVVVSLLESNNSAAMEKESSYLRLPLHVATLSRCSPKVIGALVKASPKAARIRDIHGRLPIHFACRDQENGERSLRYLLKVYPESATVADNQGFLPLHVACSAGMPMKVIKMLLRVAPESILAKTKNGTMPLHFAKKVNGKGKTQDSVVDLLERATEKTIIVVREEGPLSPLRSPRTVIGSGGKLQVDYGLLRSIGTGTPPKKDPAEISVDNPVRPTLIDARKSGGSLWQSFSHLEL